MLTCSNYEYKSRFNIKLFSCLGDAYEFYYRINEFINVGDVVQKKYIFDQDGKLRRSYSANSDCLTTVYECLIKANCVKPS